MRLLALSIRGFRGVHEANLRFGQHDVPVGPNGAGKSTIIDALSLVFGRTRLVRDLTEHDFYGSRPQATSRIRIVATLAGFDGDDPDRNDNWFREGRAVPKWWGASTGGIEPEPSAHAHTLCAQLALAARFDLEELRVDQLRYFHDDDDVQDPFLDDAIQPIPSRLFDDVGYYVLPARRTWEGVASFASDLFRKAVATVGGIPAQTVLEERDRLRAPPRHWRKRPASHPWRTASIATWRSYCPTRRVFDCGSPRRTPSRCSEHSFRITPAATMLPCQSGGTGWACSRSRPSSCCSNSDESGCA